MTVAAIPTKRMTRTIIAVGVAAALLAACGGGGSDDSPDPADDQVADNPMAIVEEPIVAPAPVDELPTPDPRPVAEPPVPTPEPSPEPAPDPQPEPTPEPQPDPDPDEPEPTPQPEPEPEPQPAPAPAPEPEPVPAPEPAPAPEPQPTPEPIEGQEIIGDTLVEPFSPTRGVGVSIIQYGFSQFGAPEATLRMTNGSGGPIYNANCDIAAFRDNTIVDTASAFFASLDPIDMGESALDAAAWRDLDGLGDIDRIRVSCDWLNGDGDRIDIASGPVTAEFAGYRSSFSGKPAVALRLVNNSGVTIYNAACGVEAKRGNVILDVASLFFADLGDIRPGEAAEEEGTWFELDSLDDFESEPFNIENVNCTRLVRR